MDQSVLQIRKLTPDDYDALANMRTNIEDDYVVRIFPDLIQREDHSLYGIFENSQLVSIAGYSIFGKKFAILGRLRSDIRFHSKGFATDILQYIINDLKEIPHIKWVGAATQEPNKAAKKVLDKLDVPAITKYHSLILNNKEIQGTPGPLWSKVTNTMKKKELLASIKENKLNMFPYECYYPLPVDESLFNEDYLNKCTFYQNPERNRFMIIKDDRKGDWYAHIKYFWNDHFEQPGFWETVTNNLTQHSNDISAWIDFSHEGFKKIPYLKDFNVQEPWILYGKSL